MSDTIKADRTRQTEALRSLTLPQVSAVADLLGLDELELAQQIVRATGQTHGAWTEARA